MKIVVAGPAGGYGGLEVHTTELAKFLRKSGHEIFEIHVLSGKSRKKPSIQSVSIANHSGLLSNFCKLCSWAYAFVRVWIFRPKLLISVGFGPGYSWLSRLSGSDCFSIIQVVTDDFRVAPKLFPKIIDAFDAIGAQTPKLKAIIDTMTNRCIPSNVLPCFHQISQDYATSGSDQLDSKKICLAYFGRLAGNKGLPLLLEALHSLKSPLLEKLDIWGTGPMKGHLEDFLCKYPDLCDKIFLKGSYPCGSAYIDLLSSYQGLVLPSQACEGLPLVLLEAASVGLPILTTRIGGIEDFITDNPDALSIGLGLEALKDGLQTFLSMINANTFSKDRQKTYFIQHYSRGIIETCWDRLVCNPKSFFHS